QRSQVSRARLAQLDARHRVGGTRDSGVGAAEAEPHVELAAPRGGIEVAGRIVVDADLFLCGSAGPVGPGGLRVDGGLEQTVGACGSTARNAERRDDFRAGRGALVPGRSVGRTVVALLPTFRDAVATAFQATRRRAAVTGDVIPVVALL